MTKLAWWRHQAELEGRHSQAELSSLYTSIQVTRHTHREAGMQCQGWQWRTLAPLPPGLHKYLHNSLALHSGMDAGLVRAHSESSATDGS